MTPSPPARPLRVRLNPRNAMTPDTFAARWWAAYLYAPLRLPTHRRDQWTPESVTTGRDVTLITRADMTEADVDEYVRAATGAVREALEQRGEIHIRSVYKGPYLVTGELPQPLVPVPPLWEDRLPGHVEMHVRNERVRLRRRDVPWLTLWTC